MKTFEQYHENIKFTMREKEKEAQAKDPNSHYLVTEHPKTLAMILMLNDMAAELELLNRPLWRKAWDWFTSHFQD